MLLDENHEIVIFAKCSNRSEVIHSFDKCDLWFRRRASCSSTEADATKCVEVLEEERAKRKNQIESQKTADQAAKVLSRK